MRYDRQRALGLIGSRQKLLEKGRAVIIGVGGLGTNCAEMLARAGVGKLVLVDRDRVELENLQRQALFTEKDIGKYKAKVAAAMLEKINSEIKVEAVVKELNADNAGLLKSDIVLDCTDNLETRHLINEYCSREKIAWVHASVQGAQGMVMSFVPGNGICYNCIFRDSFAKQTTKTAGILNTTVKAVASFQVTEAMKILTKQEAGKEMLHVNLWKQTLERIKVKQDKNCNVCNGKYKLI